MTDFGWIEPDAYGKLHWPFGRMVEGDMFRVHPDVRPRGKVATMTASRSYQLDRKFSMVTEPDGTMTVYCGQPPAIAKPPQTLSYRLFGEWMRYRRRGDADALPWNLMAEPIGSEHFLKMDMSQFSLNRRRMLHVNPFLFGVEIVDEGIRLVSLDPETSPEQWGRMLEARRLLDD